MTKYHITAPLWGSAYTCVEAESKEQAIEIASGRPAERPCATGSSLDYEWAHSGNDYGIDEDVSAWDIEEDDDGM